MNPVLPTLTLLWQVLSAVHSLGCCVGTRGWQSLTLQPDTPSNRLVEKPLSPMQTALLLVLAQGWSDHCTGSHCLIAGVVLQEFIVPRYGRGSMGLPEWQGQVMAALPAHLELNSCLKPSLPSSL